MRLGIQKTKDTTPKSVVLRYPLGDHKVGDLVEYPTWRAEKLIKDGYAEKAPLVTLKRAKKA